MTTSSDESSLTEPRIREWAELARTHRVLVGAPGHLATPTADGLRIEGPLVRLSQKQEKRLYSAVVPARADEDAEVVDLGSGMRVRFALLGAQATPRTRDTSGILLHRDALGPGRDLLRVPREHGVEDLVGLPKHPAAESVRYRFDASAASGLRLVDDVLELLDDGGSPRLRVGRPAVFDRHGRMHRAELRLDDCSADRSPAPPWGRPTTRPETSSCTLSVHWDLMPDEYPALVDPMWETTTNNPTARRRDHSATLLPSGIVLVAGGRNASGDSLGLVEYFNPSMGGNDVGVAVGPPLLMPRHDHTATAVGGVVVIAGGVNSVSICIVETATGGGCTIFNNVLGSAEYLGPTSLAWTPTPNLKEARTDHAAIEWDGTVLICGGRKDDSAVVSLQYVCERYLPPPSNQWVAGPPNLFAGEAPPEPLQRYGHAFVRASIPAPPATGTQDRIVMIGGFNPGFAGGSLETCASIPAVGNPSYWYRHNCLAEARHGHTATVLDSGKILVVGGYTGTAPNTVPTGSAELLFSPPSAQPNSLSKKHVEHTSTALPGDRALVAGGNEGTASNNTSRVLSNGDWYEVAPFGPRAGHTATGLADGRVLVVGGDLTTSGLALPQALVFALDPNGSACTNPAWACASGFCVDGVCCNESCGGSCRACKGTGVDGTCGNTAAGTIDPSCPQDECTGSTLTQSSCDGNGACQASSAPCEDGYTCASVSACKTSCSKDEDCVTSTHHCANGACAPKKDNGAACFQGNECKSQFCAVESVNGANAGVCCDDPQCAFGCFSCFAANKESDSDSGTCGPAKAGTDPHSHYNAVESSCGTSDKCGATGECALASAGTPCGGGATCQGNTLVGQLCDGAGTCAIGSTNASDCGAGKCTPQGCKTTCEKESDCDDVGGYCKDGLCIETKPNGAECASGEECESGKCVDGFCCNSPCDGQCQACSIEGNEGTCLPVTGEPRNGRPPCDVGDGVDPCTATTCNGGDPNSCAGYVSGIECRSESCVNGTHTFPATCGGTGACPAPVTEQCACDSQQIGCRKVVCNGDHECGDGEVCAPDHTCVPAAAAPEVDPEESGCGCRTRRSPAGSGWAVMTALACVALRRRRFQRTP